MYETLINKRSVDCGRIISGNLDSDKLIEAIADCRKMFVKHIDIPTIRNRMALSIRELAKELISRY